MNLTTLRFLFLCWFCVGPPLFGTTARDIQAEGQIKSIAAAFESFHAKLGRHPTTDEGLAALVVRPPNIQGDVWRPFLPGPVPKDPWGHDFAYRCPGIHNTNGFDLYSLGKDAMTQSNGADDDDINNWDATRKWTKQYRNQGSWSEVVWACAGAVFLLIGTRWWRRRVWQKSR